MKKRWQASVIILQLFIIIVNCKMPDVEEIVQPDRTEPEIIIEKEIIEMKLLPIEEADAYVFTDDKRVLAIKEALLTAVDLKDEEGNGYQFNDFFVSQGIMFFNIITYEKGDPIPDTDPVQYEPLKVTHYYKQEKEFLTEITEAQYPAKPESDFITMEKEPFQIIKYEYQGIDTSRVIKDGKPTSFVMIDAFHKVKDGLWFSVPTTDEKGIRFKGVHFYPLSGNLPARPKITGRIWK